MREVLSYPASDPIVRDASIQRFEFSFEAVWKAARLVLASVEGLEYASPKGVIRGCRSVGILSDAETKAALAMVDDRNLTSHTYDEELAQRLYQRLPDHLRLMQAWLERLEERTRE